MRKRNNQEKQTENEILGFLRMIDVFCWKAAQIDEDFKREVEPYGIRGISHIHALMFGKFIAVTVKPPTASIEKEQRSFLVKVNEEGHVGIVARSLPTFVEELAKHFPEHGEFHKMSKEYLLAGGREH